MKKTGEGIHPKKQRGSGKGWGHIISAQTRAQKGPKINMLGGLKQALSKTTGKVGGTGTMKKNGLKKKDRKNSGNWFEETSRNPKPLSFEHSRGKKKDFGEGRAREKLVKPRTVKRLLLTSFARRTTAKLQKKVGPKKSHSTTKSGSNLVTGERMIARRGGVLRPIRGYPQEGGLVEWDRGTTEYRKKKCKATCSNI